MESVQGLDTVDGATDSATALPFDEVLNAKESERWLELGDAGGRNWQDVAGICMQVLLKVKYPLRRIAFVKILEFRIMNHQCYTSQTAGKNAETV